LIENPFLIENR